MTRDEFKDLLAVAMHVGRILHHIEKANRKRGIPTFGRYPAVCARMDAGGARLCLAQAEAAYVVSVGPEPRGAQ